MNRIKKWMAESSPEYVIVRVSDREVSFGSILETVTELGIDFGEIPVPHSVRELMVAVRRHGGIYKAFVDSERGAKFWINGKKYLILQVEPGKLLVGIGRVGGEDPAFYFDRELEWEALPSSWSHYSPGNALQSFEDVAKLARDLEKSGWNSRFMTDVTDETVEIVETGEHNHSVFLSVWRPR